MGCTGQDHLSAGVVVRNAGFWYNLNVMRFGTEKKDMVRRLGTVFAAVFMWLSVCTAPLTGSASAHSFPAAGPSAAGVFAAGGGAHDGASIDVPVRIDAADISRAIPQEASPLVPAQTIANQARQQAPAGAGNTKGSRVFASGNPSGGNEKAPGPRLSAFMANAGLTHLFTNHTSAVFFSDKEAKACSLTVIQYLHAQDGLKG